MDYEVILHDQESRGGDRVIARCADFHDAVQLAVWRCYRPGLSPLTVQPVRGRERFVQFPMPTHVSWPLDERDGPLAVAEDGYEFRM
jgi:hypothetical protein